MSLLSLLINLMQPCWIKVFICSKKSLKKSLKQLSVWSQTLSYEHQSVSWTWQSYLWVETASKHSHETHVHLCRGTWGETCSTQKSPTHVCACYSSGISDTTHTRPSLFLWHTLSSHRSSHSSMWVMFTRTSLMSHHIRQTHLPSRCVGAWLKTGHTPMTIYTANTVLKLM